MIARVSDVLHALKREKEKEKRSPHWAADRRGYLKTNPACAACGSKLFPQVHHIVPFHEDPSRERDPTNWITLCAWRGCHLGVGHGKDFKFFNPNVVEDAKAYRHATPLLRRTILAGARVRRLPNDGR